MLMSQVSLYRRTLKRCVPLFASISLTQEVQGYLAYKKPEPPRTLQ